MNITDALYRHARERPAHLAIEDGKRIISYLELAALVDRAVSRLQARTIKPGETVVVSLPDTAEHIVALFALAKLGAVSLSVPESSLDHEKSTAIEGMGVKAAILANGAARFLDLGSIPVGALVDGTAKDEAAVGQLTTPAAFDGDLPLMVTQSSGTTGVPKRLLLGHRQIVERNQPKIALLRLSASDRFLQVPYLRFGWGRVGAIVMMNLGGTIVLNHGKTTEDFLRYFSDAGITCANLTPFHLRSILSCVTSDTPLWPNLRIAFSGAPLSAQERLLVRQRLTPHLLEAYSSNEAGDVALASPEDQDRYPDSSGRLIAGIEARIADPNGSLLPFGETGEIGLRARHFPREYLRNPEANARHFRDGWFYPGDLAALNREGYVFLKGRTDDVINNAGVKYFPAEVEAVLLLHPSVADVAVIGGPHPIFGEVSVAYVVASAAIRPNELHKLCDGRIAMYKAPHWVFFLDALPRVAVGKPDKKKLRAMFRHYLETEGR